MSHEQFSKELFTDVPTGAVHEADLVVRARTRQGELELIAPALASLMKTGEQRPTEVKVQALLRVAQAMVNEAQRALLTNCVELCLPLSENEQQWFESLTRQSEYREVTEMKSVYEIRREALGEARGKRKAALFCYSKSLASCRNLSRSACR